MVSITGIQDIVKRGSTNNILASVDINNIVQSLPETLGADVDLTSLTSIVKEARGLPVDQAVAYLYQMLSLVDSDPRTQELELEDDTISLSSALATKLGISDGSSPTLSEEENIRFSTRLATITDVFAHSDVTLEGNTSEDNLTDDRFILTRQNANPLAPIQDDLQSVFEMLGFDQVLDADDGQLTYGYFTNATGDIADDAVGIIPDDNEEIGEIILATPLEQENPNNAETVSYTRQAFQDLILDDAGGIDYELLKQVLIALGASGIDAQILSDNLQKSAVGIGGILDALDDGIENITTDSVAKAVANSINSPVVQLSPTEVTPNVANPKSELAEGIAVNADEALRELKSSLALIGVGGNILNEADPDFALEFYKKFGNRPAGVLQLMLDGNGDGVLDQNDADFIRSLNIKSLDLDSQLKALSLLDLDLSEAKKEALKIVHFSGALKTDGTLHTLSDLPDNIDDIKRLVTAGQNVATTGDTEPEETIYTRQAFQDLILDDAGEVDYDVLKQVLIALGASGIDAQILSDNLQKSAVGIGGILDALDDEKENITTESVKQAITNSITPTVTPETSVDEKTEALSELKSSLALIGVGGSILNEADPNFVLEFYKRFGNRPAGVIQVMLDGNGDNILDQNDADYIKSLKAESLDLSNQLEALSSLNLTVNDDREAALKVIHLSGALKPNGNLYGLKDLPETIDEVKNLVTQAHTISPTSLL